MDETTKWRRLAVRAGNAIAAAANVEGIQIENVYGIDDQDDQAVLFKAVHAGTERSAEFKFTLDGGFEVLLAEGLMFLQSWEVYVVIEDVKNIVTGLTK